MAVADGYSSALERAAADKRPQVATAYTDVIRALNETDAANLSVEQRRRLVETGLRAERAWNDYETARVAHDVETDALIAHVRRLRVSRALGVAIAGCLAAIVALVAWPLAQLMFAAVVVSARLLHRRTMHDARSAACESWRPANRALAELGAPGGEGAAASGAFAVADELRLASMTVSPR